ncbi:MAG: LamG domain-containing protein, partial [Sedimentisphaerales bacterium]|nr:LamG domain-containing protein [Sedimentisphaerales bacterium]
DGWSSGSESYWQFLITDTGVVRMQSRGLSTINTPAVINADQWHHVAVTFASNYAKIYVDGMVAAQDDFSLAAGPDSTFRIGCNDLTNERFEGRLDDMQVFNYALSAEEIADLYFDQTGEELCIYGRPVADVSGDCVVDLLDLGIMADRWLESGYYPALP